ncbi:hypothetical protein C3L33_23206, partial [Rhododendron williamsianum]
MASTLRLSIAALSLSLLALLAEPSSNTNPVYSPCSDTTVQKSDGFSFAIAFAALTAFFVNTSVQLSPCDRRLSLSSSSNAEIALFRPKVDEISLLTINTTNGFTPGFGNPRYLLTAKEGLVEGASGIGTGGIEQAIPGSKTGIIRLLPELLSSAFTSRCRGSRLIRAIPTLHYISILLPVWTCAYAYVPGIFEVLVISALLISCNSLWIFQASTGGYMVAFAGQKYAAISSPAFVANSTYTVTSFTLVLTFQKGRLQNLYWKRDGCASCSGNSSFVCLNNQDCAIKTNSCKNQGGSVDCSLGIQLAFSGTDKHEGVFNSWYEVSNLRQYSLYGLYSNLKGSLTSQYNSFF